MSFSNMGNRYTDDTKAKPTTLGRGVKREHSPTDDDALIASTLRASKYKSTFDTTLEREVVDLDS